MTKPISKASFNVCSAWLTATGEPRSLSKLTHQEVRRWAVQNLHRKLSATERGNTTIGPYVADGDYVHLVGSNGWDLPIHEVISVDWYFVTELRAGRHPTGKAAKEATGIRNGTYARQFAALIRNDQRDPVKGLRANQRRSYAAWIDEYGRVLPMRDLTEVQVRKWLKEHKGVKISATERGATQIGSFIKGSEVVELLNSGGWDLRPAEVVAVDRYLRQQFARGSVPTSRSTQKATGIRNGTYARQVAAMMRLNGII